MPCGDCFGQNKKKKDPTTAADLGLSDGEGRETIDKLLNHAYHLPRHVWWQDWIQYMTNNHPVFGICCHHPLHPLSWKLRVATLLGSVFMGLAITCLIYVAFVFSAQDYDQQYVEISTNKTKTGLQDDLDQNVSTLSVTSGNIALWTVGAFLHGLYDNMVWALAAGTCCACRCCEEKCGRKKPERGGRRNGRNHDDNSTVANEGPSSTRTLIVMLSVVVVIAITFFAVSLQMALTTDDATEIVVVNTTNVATLNNHNSTASNSTAAGSGVVLHREQLFRVKTDSANDYEFIVAYLVELALSYFAWYPIVGTILFSGCLSCGKEPLLGGRPYEMKQDELEAAERGGGQQQRRRSSLDSMAVSTTSAAAAAANKKSTNNNTSTRSSGLPRNSMRSTTSNKSHKSTNSNKKSTTAPKKPAPAAAKKSTNKKPVAKTNSNNNNNTKKPASSSSSTTAKKKPATTKTSLKVRTTRDPKTGKLQKSTTVSVTKR